MSLGDKVKASLKPKEKYKVYLTYEETHEVTRDDFDSKTWNGRHESDIEFTPLSLHTIAGNSAEEIEVGFDPEVLAPEVLVYLLIVRYEDGGTFGCTTGNWHIEHIGLSESEALEIKRRIEGDDRYYHEAKYYYGKNKKPYTSSYTGSHGYKPWQGFFEKLERVEIHAFKLNKTQSNGIIFH